MNRTWLLRERGQSLWLDNITREILDDGTPRLRLRRDGTQAFSDSWTRLLGRIAGKSAALAAAR
jgi:hypothetical protein